MTHPVIHSASAVTATTAMHTRARRPIRDNRISDSDYCQCGQGLIHCRKFGCKSWQSQARPVRRVAGNRARR